MPVKRRETVQVEIGQEYEDTDPRMNDHSGQPRRVRVIQMYKHPGSDTEWMAQCVTVGSNRKINIACRRLAGNDYRLVKSAAA